MAKPRPKVLVVEDEVIIGLDLVDTLEEQGFDALGPFTTPEQAVEAFQKETPDIGVLDVNLGDDATSEPVAAKFQDADRPFVFVTGHVASGYVTLQKYAGTKQLSKPVNTDELVRWLRQALRSTDGASSPS